jgi:hypothetical protein
MSLRRDKDTLFAVAEVADRVQGFVIARLVPSPPVYEPGGTTCLVDDFTVADVQMWPEVGPCSSIERAHGRPTMELPSWSW